jgi:hypothetical protein
METLFYLWVMNETQTPNTMQTDFPTEPLRKSSKHQVIVQVFTGLSARYVYCETPEDAMRCVEINRNWGIPAGIIANPQHRVKDVYMMPTHLIA